MFCFVAACGGGGGGGPTPPPPTAAECENRGQTLRNGICTTPTNTECHTRNQRLNNAGTACRALIATDCQTNGMVLYNNSCAAPSNMACRSQNMGFDSATTMCRALIAADCQVEKRVLENGLCTASDALCRNQNMGFDSATTMCRPPTNTECRTRNQRLNDERTACRPLTAADCQMDGQILNSATNVCRPPTDTECRNRNMRLNNAATACRPLTAADCMADGGTINTEMTKCIFQKAAACLLNGRKLIGGTCMPDAATEIARSAAPLSLIQANYAYTQGYNGQGVTIGISDGIGSLGITISAGFHEDLAANYVSISLRLPSDSIGASFAKTPVTLIQHGIGVAAVAVAAKNDIGIVGVAPQAKWAFQNYAPMNNWFLNFAGKVPIVNLSYRSMNALSEVPFRGNPRYNGQPVEFNFYDAARRIVPVPLGYEPFWQATLNWQPFDFAITTGNYRTTITSTLREYIKSYAKAAEDTDTIFVWAAGNNGWHRGNLTRYPTDFTDAIWGKLPLTMSIPTADSMAPALNPKLRDKWLAVVAFDEDRATLGLLAGFSNGCGGAKMWCLAAPGSITVASYDSSSGTVQARYINAQGTSGAAPHVSGALALLKSAAPMLPMTIIHGIILTTATDYGDKGVDDVFGWGLVNVAAAITLIENMKTAGSTAINLRDLQFTVPQELSHITARMDDSAAIALEITDGTYYNLPLSKIAKTQTANNNQPTTAPDLHDLDSSLSDYADKNYSALPFFTRKSGGGVLLQTKEDGLRPFASFDGKNNIKNSTYQQLGFRWQKTQNSFGVVAEISHIMENDSFWGLNFGALGNMSAQTEQAKLLLSGDLDTQWSGFAGFEHAQARGILSNSAAGNFIVGIEDATAAGWTAGLERRGLFSRDDKLRFLARQKTRISGGGLILETPQASGGFTEAFYGEIQQKLETRRTVIPMREQSSVIWGIGYATEGERATWSAAVEHDDGHSDTSLSAQWEYEF